MPSFGPAKFRVLVGLLFLPYTGMVLSFVLMGSMLAQKPDLSRLAALLAIYFLGLGIGAHALDALGSKGAKPWGMVFGRSELKLIAALSLVLAYAVALHYMLNVVPLLWTMALLEGFFVFAYNLEWFGGRFHTDFWFALSWGALPTLAGFIMQENGLSAPALAMAFATAMLGAVEIKISRPYKEFRKRAADLSQAEHSVMIRLEAALKCVSLGTVLLGLSLAWWRLAG